jgi:AmmeMemoRadiSam system protein B
MANSSPLYKVLDQSFVNVLYTFAIISFLNYMNQVRRSTVSGMFYDARETDLNDQIKNCFLSERGPGFIAEEIKSSSLVKAVIVPHAGYPFSGSIAAYAYNEILKTGLADVFIVLGPNHHGTGSGIAMSTSGFWETPLGKIPVDNEITQKLTNSIIDPDDHTMSYQENSIEVQLPFLQFISKDKPFSIVPIAMLMQDIDTANEIGAMLAQIIRKEHRKIVLIASTDFSHEGLAYGRMIPKNTNIHQYVSQQDSLALDMIMHLDPEGLLTTVQSHDLSMCGSGPVATVLSATNNLGISAVELLKYGTSYEVHPDSNACVGYASFAFYEKKK